MARALFSIAPSVLRWARERAGFSVAELSADFRDYADWETGKAGPSYPQLEALGNKLKVPVALFFFPEPPETSPIEETFRTLPDTVLYELPPKVRLLLRSLWEKFDELVASGDISSVREVLREVNDSALQNMKDWAANNGGIFTPPSAEEGAFIG